MRKEHLTRAGIFLGTVMFVLASYLAAWGADALPPRTVLLASTDTTDTIVEATDAEATEVVEYASCDYGEEIYLCAPLFSRVKFGGWMETGIYANSHGNTSKFDGDGFIGTSGNSSQLGKLKSTGWQAQQLWLFAERELINDGCGFDWGFRVDAMFGTDGYDLQSWGDGSFDGNWRPGSEYGAAIPQMYLELGYNRWSLKLGKFNTPLGYESTMAPEQTFYSHSYLYAHEPASHFGALLTFNWSENLSVYGGLTTGADTGWGNEYGDFGILVGFNAQLTDKISVGYGFMWNDVNGGYDQTRVTPGMWDSGNYWGLTTFSPARFHRQGSGDETLHSFVLEWQITCRLKYALQANYGRVHKDANTNAAGYKGEQTLYEQTLYEQFGMANYLEYQLTDNLSAGLRLEWFRQNMSGRVHPDNWRHQNIYSMTFGLNYTPCEWLAIRPEIRYDTAYGYGKNMFNDGKDNDQLMGGVGVIVSF